MNYEFFNFTETNDLEFQSSFPLFNFEALKKAESFAPVLNFALPERFSGDFEEIVTKKFKTNEVNEVAVKKCGRKPIAKNAKVWDDPTITLKEIIENDLAGEPTQADAKLKDERLRKMREAKALKKAGKTNASAIAPAANVSQIENSLIPAVEGPQVIFKDGKVVVFEAPEKFGRQALQTVEDKKPFKLTSMSFRTKNHTAKWTPEETKKFYKAIEIFGADFSMIANLFPTRNRNQLKNKFNKEEKTNSRLIDEAFKKNKTLGKRSIMGRIRNFNKLLEGEEVVPAIDEIGTLSKLERNLSNVSTDSMDLRIMGEIQDIFLKEIRPTNLLVTPFRSIGTTVEDPVKAAETEFDGFFNFDKVQGRAEQREVENLPEVVPQRRPNLLARFLV